MAKLNEGLCNILCNDEKAIEEPEISPLDELFKKEYDINYDLDTCTSAKEPAKLSTDSIIEMIKNLPKRQKTQEEIFKDWFHFKPMEPNFEIKHDENSYKSSTFARFGVPSQLLGDYNTIRIQIKRHKKRRINKKLNKRYGAKYIEKKFRSVPLMFSCMA